MSQPNYSSLDAWMDARVEAYVDDALSPNERARFESILRADAHWQEQVERAQSIRGALRTQASPPAPDDLTTSILRRASTSRPCSKKEA